MKKNNIIDKINQSKTLALINFILAIVGFLSLLLSIIYFISDYKITKSVDKLRIHWASKDYVKLAKTVENIKGNDKYINEYRFYKAISIVLNSNIKNDESALFYISSISYDSPLFDESIILRIPLLKKKSQFISLLTELENHFYYKYPYYLLKFYLVNSTNIDSVYNVLSQYLEHSKNINLINASSVKIKSDIKYASIDADAISRKSALLYLYYGNILLMSPRNMKEYNIQLKSQYELKSLFKTHYDYNSIKYGYYLLHLDTTNSFSNIINYINKFKVKNITPPSL